MRSTPRDILLVGSVPLAPAEQVFATLAKHLGGLLRRFPDGEQIGWSSAARRAFLRHEAFEIDRTVPLNAMGADPVPILRLRRGHRLDDLAFGPYGYAENAIASYATFNRMQSAGTIAADVRFQATLPGPGTSAFNIALPAERLLPLARAALWAEIEAMLAHIPAERLTIQLDIAMEAEHEEWLRRPQDFDQPLHKAFNWTLEQMAESAAWLANQIPPSVELGFHVCSIWHHDPSAGQDNRALADIWNAIAARVERPIGYVHIPAIPEHDAADFAQLRTITRRGNTTLFLGLLNWADGLDGAKRRIAAAESVLDDFGIGFFCGLGRPPRPEATGPSAHYAPPIPALRRSTPETIGEMLNLHRAAACLDGHKYWI